MKNKRLVLLVGLAALCLSGNLQAEVGLFHLESSSPVIGLIVDGQALTPNSSSFDFQSEMRVSDPGTADAVRISFSAGTFGEVAWARPYTVGPVQMWDKGDVIAYGSSSGRQHDVEGGPTQDSPITTSAACGFYSGISISITKVSDEDGDGVQDADDLCPGTPPGTIVGLDGCPDEDLDGVWDACDVCPQTLPGTTVDAQGCPLVGFSWVMDADATQWADFNDDGFSDMSGGSNLYTNQGDGTFVHTTPFGGRGAGSVGDYNNDGLIDAYSLDSYGVGALYFNNGDGTYTNRTDLVHWVFEDTPRNSNGQTCVDLNGDGYLDTYMTGWWDWEQWSSADVIFTSEGDGVSDPCWRKTWEQIPYRHCKSATPCDFDEDGDQDVYVSGYWLAYGHLWRNDGFNGSTGLTDVALPYGVNDGPGHTQGSCWADFDNDGHFDIFVANFAHPGNPSARFMQNQGEPGYHFTNRGLCGVVQVQPLSCGIAGDYDNDGDVDLVVTTSGGYGDFEDIWLYRNNGNWTFTDVTASMGLDDQGPYDYAAWGDYNNDGLLDLIAVQQLWRNHNGGAGNHWLKVKLKGGDHADGMVNGAAIGAQVRIDVPGLGTLVRQVEGNTGQVGCQNDLTLHFGLGSHSTPVDLLVDWPNGYQETVYAVAVDQAITVQLEPPLTYHELTTSVVGNVGGTIAPASGPQLEGSVVNLVADPCDGWLVKQWGGDAVIQPGAGLTNNTVIMDAAKSVTVEFEQLVTVPPCWDYPTQCHGDCDGSGVVDTADWPEFRDAFGYTYPAAQYNPCGDCDRDGDVDTADWPEFRDSFGYSAAADCTLGGTWPPTP